MLRILLFVIFVSATQAAFSQSAEDSIKAAVNQLFAAMKDSDANKLRSTFSSTAVLQTVNVDRTGAVTIGNETVDEFADIVAKTPAGMLDERIRFEKIYIDGPLATVWTPYNFYYNGKFSHCGVNSFQLVRIGNEWKIQYIIDTRRVAGCAE
ncbi:MAG: nuclear transport factor 2 family protein [Chitinophagaceae bacterium]|nr:nuclear transport factor 2 family protein [Chitinophagaceae bacterium]